MDDGTQLTCARHGVPTRITCVECETPICPECAIRTAVGLKCPDHATRPAAPRRSRIGLVALVVVVLGVVGFGQLARTTGTGKPGTPRCPTETAPDVGIGSSGGGHWKELTPTSLCGRYHAAVVWTGTEMVVWGGVNCAGAACPTDLAPHLADGAAYVPADNKWRPLAASPLSARQPAATAWTGTEMLVWGGSNGDSALADGAAYQPFSNTWRPMAPAQLDARAGAVSAWTGKELLVWGGSADGRDWANGAAYDPAADRWRPMAAGPLAGRARAVGSWTGRELVVWGGGSTDGTKEFTDGAAYDPAADRWRRIAAGPLSGRYDAATAWTGKELVIWGGNAPGTFAYDDGAAYDPATDRWRSLPPAPVAARTDTAAVWTGTQLLVWGGVGGPGASGTNSALDRVIERRTSVTPLNDGVAYDPVANSWRTLPPVSLLGRGFPAAVWDGQGMIVWGGLVAVSSPASAADGVRYTA